MVLAKVRVDKGIGRVRLAGIVVIDVLCKLVVRHR